jgi:uncharacterized protein
MNEETKKVQFLVKTSKYCSYEFAELGNKNAIALTQIQQLFANIVSYYQHLDFTVEIEFVWHSG